MASLSGASPSTCLVLVLAPQHFQGTRGYEHKFDWNGITLDKCHHHFARSPNFHKVDFCIEEIITRQLPTWPVLARNAGITLLTVYSRKWSWQVLPCHPKQILFFFFPRNLLYHKYCWYFTFFLCFGFFFLIIIIVGFSCLSFTLLRNSNPKKKSYRETI